MNSDVTKICHTMNSDVTKICHTMNSDVKNMSHNELWCHKNMSHNELWCHKNMSHNELWCHKNMSHNELWCHKNMSHNELWCHKNMSHNELWCHKNMSHNELWCHKNATKNVWLLKMYDLLPKAIPCDAFSNFEISCVWSYTSCAICSGGQLLELLGSAARSSFFTVVVNKTEKSRGVKPRYNTKCEPFFCFWKWRRFTILKLNSSIIIETNFYK